MDDKYVRQFKKGALEMILLRLIAREETYGYALLDALNRGGAQVLGYASSAEMLESATGRQFGVVMILMSVGMLSGFLILLPFGKKLCKSVDRSAADNGGSTWKNVLSGVFMLVMFSVYIPILLFTDNVQAAVMITGLVIAVGVGVLAKRPGLAWLNNFVMAFSMLGGLISSLAWVRIFG